MVFFGVDIAVNMLKKFFIIMFHILWRPCRLFTIGEKSTPEIFWKGREPEEIEGSWKEAGQKIGGKKL